MNITTTSTNCNLINITITIISTIHLLLLLLVREVVIVRAGSARLRFARVPRVLFCAGSARVVAFKFLQEINKLRRILLLLLLIIV